MNEWLDEKVDDGWMNGWVDKLEQVENLNMRSRKEKINLCSVVRDDAMHYQNSTVSSDCNSFLYTHCCNFFFFVSTCHPNSYCTVVHTTLRVILSLLYIRSLLLSVPSYFLSLILWHYPTPLLIAYCLLFHHAQLPWMGAMLLYYIIFYSLLYYLMTEYLILYEYLLLFE